MVWPFPSLPNSYLATIAEKRAERAHALKTASAEELSYEETQIVGSTAQFIVAAIRQKKWTSTQVIHAFMKSALRAQLLTNALTEVMFEDAVREAESLDADFAITGKLKGSLHGLPVSFKDQHDIKGYDTTIGFTGWAHKPAARDADLVKTIRDAGGIPLYKTNVPQTMLAFECRNPLWGRTTNPYSSERTCGGSTGGEAAALAMDAATLGFGSDAGGSLRIPSHYCGVYSLKPGHGRIGRGGARGPTPGSDGITSVTGPMARSVEDLELVCRVVFGQEGRLQMPPPLTYRDVHLPAKLKLGYYTSDDFAKASPPCKRAVLETVEALRRAGHECVEFSIPSPSRPAAIYAGLGSADKYKTMLSHLGSDVKEPSLTLATVVPSLPSWVRYLIAVILRRVFGDYILTPMFSALHQKSMFDVYKLATERDDYNIEFYDKVWDHYGFDGIIAPVQAIPAVAHGGCDKLSPLANATLLYNIVDSPVGCIPVTRVDPAIDELTEEWTKRGSGKGQGSPVLENRLYGKWGAYDAVKMSGLPVGIQLVGRKWQEEKVIEMMKVVDDALGKSRGFGPSAWSRWVSDTGAKAADMV